MTTAKFVRLIFLKDVRGLRYPLLLLLALEVFTIGGVVNLTTTTSFSLFPSLWMFIVSVGAFLLTIHVVQVDPAGREYRFLLTRPVPGAAVGLAKALFLFVFVIAPYYAGLEAMVTACRIPFSLLDHLLLLAQVVTRVGALLAGLVLLSVFLRNGVAVVFTLVGLLVVTVLLSRWWHDWIFLVWPIEGPASFRGWLGESLFLVIALAAIGLRYRSRNFLAPLLLAGIGLLAGFLIACFFPYNLPRGLQDRGSGQRPLTAQELARLHLVLLQHPRHQPPYNLGGGGSSNGVRYALLDHVVQMEGLAPPYYVQTLGYQDVITLRSGKTIGADYADSPIHGGMGGLTRDLMCALAGVAPTGADDGELMLELLAYAPKNLPAEDLTGATIRGVITLDVRRAYLSGTMPIRAHAVLSFSRKSYQIENAEFSDSTVAVSMHAFQMPLILRGDLADWSNFNDQFLAIYRPWGEVLQQSGGNLSNFSVCGLHILDTHPAYRDLWNNVPPKFRPATWRALPADWPSGTELDFFGSESAGHVSFPFEIDNVDLRERP